MARDYFAVLGLTPGRYAPEEIASHFLAVRERLLAALRATDAPTETRRELDQVHLAYATLRDPARQAEYLRANDANGDATAQLRTLIAASLEDGLLRYSRRQAILERAAELGFNEFQAHLLIAQVQFGDTLIPTGPRLDPAKTKLAHPRAWARVTATGVLALAIFLYLVHWVGA